MGGVEELNCFMGKLVYKHALLMYKAYLQNNDDKVANWNSSTCLYNHSKQCDLAIIAFFLCLIFCDFWLSKVKHEWCVYQPNTRSSGPLNIFK